MTEKEENWEEKEENWEEKEENWEWHLLVVGFCCCDIDSMSEDVRSRCNLPTHRGQQKVRHCGTEAEW